MNGYEELERLVGALRYRREWEFNLERTEAVGAPYLLRILALVEDSEHPSGYVRDAGPQISLGPRDVVTPRRLEETHMIMRIVHSIPVPHAPDRGAAFWRRWLFEQIVNVERHEAAEWFVVDGDRPFFPDHTPGGDPYVIRDRLS